MISFSTLPVQATFEQVSTTRRKAQFRAERENEVAKVASLLDRAGSHDKAVLGLEPTTAALAEGRVHELVYAQGIEPNGALCAKCGSIVVNQPNCPKCETAVGPAGEAMDLIIGAALSTDAAIEQVRGEAAEKLKAPAELALFSGIEEPGGLS